MSCGGCFGSGWIDLPEGFSCSEEVVSSEAKIDLKKAGGVLFMVEDDVVIWS